LSVHERIVDHGREKVDGLDDSQVLGQLIDTGVIVSVGADEEVGVVVGGKVAQNLRDALRGQLSRSASARGVIDQTFFSAKEQHVAFSLIAGPAHSEESEVRQWRVTLSS
jgi:hypothetical protein